ncbi:hypothetical protein G6L37_02635 [Agrobacterium rubi]|nr:hypothetical protein [Agrobacterium rubi]NTF24293.1 hypothetical protein [Agrobacterium rubi]
MSEIKLWHGSRRWEGYPEIRPGKKGQYECGPGIYCTTNLNTASKYSKGGGRIMRFTLDAELGWLEDVRVPLDDALTFLQGSRLHKKRILAQDVAATFDRNEHVRDSGMLPLTYVVNLAIYHECLSGAGGPELAEWLVDNGAQASLYRMSGKEDWVVIFDPLVIKDFEILSSKDIDWKEDMLPSVAEQLAELGGNLSLGR